MSLINERKISMQLNKMHLQIKDLTNQIHAIPCLTIDGFQTISDPERDWQSNIITLFNLNHIFKSWIYDLVNPSGHTHPDTVHIQFINNIVRNKAYKILSQYIIDQEYDCLISKEDNYSSGINLD
jgi:tRNA(Ile)-lysidine synthase TilS/MesJ